MGHFCANTESDDDDEFQQSYDDRNYDYSSDVQSDDIEFNREYRLHDDEKEGYDHHHDYGYGYKPKKKKVYVPVFVPEKEKKKSKNELQIFAPNKTQL